MTGDIPSFATVDISRYLIDVIGGDLWTVRMLVGMQPKIFVTLWRVIVHPWMSGLAFLNRRLCSEITYTSVRRGDWYPKLYVTNIWGGENSERDSRRREQKGYMYEERWSRDTVHT